MAEHDHPEEKKAESLMEKIAEKIHGHDDSSSSDSDNDKSSSVKDKIYRLFGRERPVHHVLGGGKRMLLSPPYFIPFFMFVCLWVLRFSLRCVI